MWKYFKKNYCLIFRIENEDVNIYLYFNGYLLTLSFDGGLCYIETSPLIWPANQLTGFYVIGNSVLKKLMLDFTFSLRSITGKLINANKTKFEIFKGLGEWSNKLTGFGTVLCFYSSLQEEDIVSEISSSRFEGPFLNAASFP